MSSAKPQKGPKVVLTQTELFFPPPITGPIENIVKIVNLENARVAYKFRASVKNRYQVRPAIGFLHPQGEAMIRFQFQYEEGVVYPDASTKDWIVLEVRFVTPKDDISSPNSYWYPQSASEPYGTASKIVLNCVYTTDLPNVYRKETEAPALESPADRSSPPRSTPRTAVSAPPVDDNKFVPLHRQPQKKANEPNPDFVADRYKKEGKKGSIVSRIMGLAFPLPVVLLLVVLAYAVAILEHECAPTSILVRNGLQAVGFDVSAGSCEGAYTSINGGAPSTGMASSKAQPH